VHFASQNPQQPLTCELPPHRVAAFLGGKFTVDAVERITSPAPADSKKHHVAMSCETLSHFSEA